jgi:hypothetical protein
MSGKPPDVDFVDHAVHLVRLGLGVGPCVGRHEHQDGGSLDDGVGRQRPRELRGDKEVL